MTVVIVAVHSKCRGSFTKLQQLLPTENAFCWSFSFNKTFIKNHKIICIRLEYDSYGLIVPVIDVT